MPFGKGSGSSSGSGSSAETAASIKSKYESNSNTNAFTDSEKSKLASIGGGASIYISVNGGADIGLDDRIEIPLSSLPADFQGKDLVKPEAEIEIAGKFGGTGWIYSGTSYGVDAYIYDGNIVVQTGVTGLTATRSNESGNPHGHTTSVHSAPCRVKVTRVN